VGNPTPFKVICSLLCLWRSSSVHPSFGSDGRACPKAFPSLRICAAPSTRQSRRFMAIRRTNARRKGILHALWLAATNPPSKCGVTDGIYPLDPTRLRDAYRFGSLLLSLSMPDQHKQQRKKKSDLVLSTKPQRFKRERACERKKRETTKAQHTDSTLC
jgi:hypothetical protein